MISVILDTISSARGGGPGRVRFRRKRLGEVWATAEAHRTGTDVASRIAKDGKKTLRAPEVRAYLEFDPSDRIVGAVYVGEFVEHSPNAPDREVDKHLTIRSQ